jgi:Protein of unknown function (DUF3558)
MATARVLRVCAAVGLAVLAGCSAPAVPDLPAIDAPRDVRGADPCALVDGTTLAAAGITAPGTATAGAEGPRCQWRGEAGRLLSVTVFTGDGGLGTLARNSEPTTTRVRVAGYPALETFTGEGEFCQYDVGIAADQALLVAFDGGEPDSCTALQTLLPPVLSLLPG